MQGIAAKSLSFAEAFTDEFAQYQKQILRNAKALAESLIAKGFRLVSGGTDNHLILIELGNKNIYGKDTETEVEESGITVNKNTIPNDPESPFITSGIRIGTPAVTTRGMKEKEMEEIAEIMDLALEGKQSKEELRNRVKNLCSKYPLYRNI